MVTPVGVIVTGILLSFGILGLGFWSFYQSRHDAYSQAEQNARNLLTVVERDITRNIEMYDLSLRAAAEGVTDPVVMALRPNYRDGLLFDRATMARNLDGIVVLDEHGRVVVDSQGLCTPGTDLSDSEYFTAHRDHAGSRLYISKPYRPRCGRGRPVISLSRRISRPDGSFGGVVIGLLAVDYFRELLEGLEVGRRGTAAVIETNGTLVALLPFDHKVVGRDLSRGDIFQKEMSANEGTFVGNASIDGTRKIYFYRHLDNLPIVVDVAPAETDVYAEWRDRALYVGVLVLGLSVSILTGSLLLGRELRRRVANEFRLRHMADTDSLTGLDNRRAFDNLIQREWLRAARTTSPLSLLFVDIDRFKALNDRCGHRFGDRVIHAVARRIAECVRRPADRVARYGGEEFIVTLPDTSGLEAAIVAETIRRSIAELALDDRGDEQHVTASIGIATWTGQLQITVDALIQLADQAVYRAKAAGRNRVHMAEPDEGLPDNSRAEMGIREQVASRTVSEGEQD